VLRHVRGETTRAIAAAHGRNQSTVARLLKAPDIIALIAEEDAKVHAVEQSQADTLREAKGREKSRRSSAKHREAVAREEFATGPTPGAPARRKRSKDAADGVLLGVALTGYAGVPGLADDDGYTVKNRAHYARLHGTTPDAVLDDIDRRINPEHTPLSGVRFGAFARSYDRLKDDLHVIADDLAREGLDAPRNDVIRALADCAPGNTAVLDFKLNVLEAPGDSDLRDTNE
jgi:hypothetical protein